MAVVVTRAAETHGMVRAPRARPEDGDRLCTYNEVREAKGEKASMPTAATVNTIKQTASSFKSVVHDGDKYYTSTVNAVEIIRTDLVRKRRE